jgi:hypothetical protein
MPQAELSMIQRQGLHQYKKHIRRAGGGGEYDASKGGGVEPVPRNGNGEEKKSGGLARRVAYVAAGGASPVDWQSLWGADASRASSCSTGLRASVRSMASRISSPHLELKACAARARSCVIQASISASHSIPHATTPVPV